MMVSVGYVIRWLVKLELAYMDLHRIYIFTHWEGDN